MPYRMTVVGALVAVSSVAFAAEGPAKVEWTKAAKSPAYVKATAWAPAYDDKAIWPVCGKEKFLKQGFEGGRVLVWAKPGQSADVKKRDNALDAYDARNWIDAATGKAPQKVLGEDCDIHLPASDTPYTVSFKKADVEHAPVTVRHITVERGAGWYSAGLKAHGNIWVKAGGRIGNHGALVLAGDKNTFFRNDNGDPSTPQRSEGSEVSQYITFDKAGASGEFIGTFSTGDEFRVFNGTLIVAPDSRVMPGRNASPLIEKGGTLALMDGAAFGKWVNQLAVIDLTCRGTLQGGLPDRPLRRDAFVGVSYQNTNGTKFYDSGALVAPQGRNLESRTVPLIFTESASIKTFSDDLKTASLVIGWVGLDAKDWHASGAGFKRSDPKSQQYLTQQLDKLPKGLVTAAFEKGVQVDGVRFDSFQAGGILMVAPDERSGWKNVAYGPKNQVKGDELFRKLTKLDSRGASYEY
jgi:hypothetical protein